jgi:hypothetical protein
MQLRVLSFIAVLSLIFSISSAQEDFELLVPSQETVTAERLVVPLAGETLNPSSFPRYISPLDVALTTGDFLINFTAGRFQLAETGPQFVDFVLEGYIANYSSSNQDFFDGDFRLLIDGVEYLPNQDVMSRLKSGYGTNRDYPGRNLPLVAQLEVTGQQAHHIFIAYRIPATSREVALQISYQNAHQRLMRLLLLPEDEDGNSNLEIYKLQIDNEAQYLLLDTQVGEAETNGVPSNIIDPFHYDNCSREPADVTYSSYTSSGKQRLRSFSLNVNPQESRSDFLVLFGALIMGSHVERSLFELNYVDMESSFELISTSIESSTTIRAFTAFNFTVMEQPMRRTDIYRVLYGTETLEFPYTIEYSVVNVEAYQEDITTEYCASR